MPSIPFWCHLSAVNLCLHTFTRMTVTLRGRGLLKNVYSC